MFAIGHVLSGFFQSNVPSGKGRRSWLRAATAAITPGPSKPVHVDPKDSDQKQVELIVWDDLEDEQKCEDARMAANLDRVHLNVRVSNAQHAGNSPKDDPSVATPTAATTSVSLDTGSQETLGSE
jgi:hypothetical protein